MLLFLEGMESISDVVGDKMSLVFYVFIYFPIFVKNMEIFENSSRNFGVDLLFFVCAMGQIYFQFVV